MSETPLSDLVSPQDPLVEIPFYMEKGKLFRVVHADGAWFTLSPHKNLHLVFFNERIPIPQEIVGKVDKEGKLAGYVEGGFKAKSGVFRELEVDISMTLEVAEGLYETLGKNIEVLKQMK